MEILLDLGRSRAEFGHVGRLLATGEALVPRQDHIAACRRRPDEPHQPWKLIQSSFINIKTAMFYHKKLQIFVYN